MLRHAKTAFLIALSAALVSTPALSDEAEVARRREAGAAAKAAGELDEARHHLLRALTLDPASVAVSGDLISLDADDPEAQALWALHTALAASDASGRFNPLGNWTYTSIT